MITPESPLGIELAKWDTKRSQGGMRPDSFEEYPKMVYRAQKNENGKVLCGDVPPPYATDLQILKADTFTKQCQRIVKDEGEERLASGQGWCESPGAAIEAFERQEQEIGNAAAEAKYRAQGMTANAQRELASAEKETAKHVTDVIPKIKRGRPAKGVHPVSGSRVLTGDR